MPTLHVCPLSCLHAVVAETGARHVVTLVNLESAVERPAGIVAERHLFLGISDIVEPLEGHVLPGAEHIERLLPFVRAWDRGAPLVFHCWAGISRSTAAAFITACALHPEREEAQLAARLRAASPSATPNRRLVAIADEILGRNGRMVAAVDGIGRGASAMEGVPFVLRLEEPGRES